MGNYKYCEEVMSMSVLCIYCAGGLGRDFFALSQVERLNNWEEILFIDDISMEKYIDNIRVLSFHDFLQERNPEDCEFVILNGEPLYRKKIYTKLKKNNCQLNKVVFNSSIVSLDALVRIGSIIHCQAIVSSGSIIEENVFIGKKAMIGHDVTIGKHSVVSACSYIGGWTRVGSGCFVGAGALVKDRVTIGKNCIVGMGSVVIKDVQDNAIVAGNPARYLGMNNRGLVFYKE